MPDTRFTIANRSSRRCNNACASSSRAPLAALAKPRRAYALFVGRYEQGSELDGRITEARSALKSCVERARAVGHALHASRDAVAHAKGLVEARRVSLAVASVLPGDGMRDSAAADGHAADGSRSADRAGGGSHGGDTEEIRLVAELQAAKERYHMQAGELKQLKQQCTALGARAEGLQAACEAAFRKWWPLACQRLGLAVPTAGTQTDAADATIEPSDEPDARSRFVPAASGSSDSGGAGAAVMETAARGVSSTQAPVRPHQSCFEPAAWLALLNNPEEALAEFRAHHWEQAKASSRDDLKGKLNEAYAAAKEAGELVGRKRQSVHELKAALSSSSADLDAAGGEERLRSQLQLDTTLYKGAVASLRELKSEIEGLQAQLAASQKVLQADFAQWHQAELDRAKKSALYGLCGRSASAMGPNDSAGRRVQCSDRTNSLHAFRQTTRQTAGTTQQMCPAGAAPMEAWACLDIS